MNPFLNRLRWFSLLVALFGFVSAAPADEAPDYSHYAQSYHLPFGNSKPVDFNHLQSLGVRVSLNGGPPMRFQVDTGSVGVIVGASDLPNIDPNAPAGSITYSSSGVELSGVWTPVTITFPDSKDAQGHVATATVQVLAVSERKVLPGAVNSGSFTPSQNPTPHMLGIGTGRGKEVHQDRNPWVNLTEMQAGTMRRGYTITRDGITLGLTARTVGQGYLYEQLKEHLGEVSSPAKPGSARDWGSSQGWAEVGGARVYAAGLLLDTGLTNMMIPKVDAAQEGEMAEGTEITVHLLNGRLSYGFKVGDAANPATPRKVNWTARRSGSIINTGLRALALFDYLYDADGGYCGLRPVAK